MFHCSWMLFFPTASIPSGIGVWMDILLFIEILISTYLCFSEEGTYGLKMNILLGTTGMVNNRL